MKIAIYTIALNEEQFAQRWVNASGEADYRVVADTGSTDGTVAKLRMAGIDVHTIAIKPWRFDHARNACLAFIPEDADICVPLDMDEILVPGWRQAMEAAWKAGATRLRYRYVWNWDAQGNPLTHYIGDKIHHRHGYAWKYPAHEVIHPLAGVREKIVRSDEVKIHHHPDPGKSRGQYLDLMALATQEYPDDDRCAHYYGRELMFRRKHAAAIVELKRHLSLPRATWKAERAASLRYIGRCQKLLGRSGEARSAFLQACAEAPEMREPWYEFGKFCLQEKDWSGGVWAAHRMLAITELPGDHTHDATAWTLGPYDVGSVCAYYSGQKELAREWLTKALEYQPQNARLIKNARLIFAPA